MLSIPFSNYVFFIIRASPIVREVCSRTIGSNADGRSYMTIAAQRILKCVLICLSFALSAHAASADHSSCSKDNRLCGPKCMLTICQKFGLKADIDELTRLSQSDEKNGTSLAGLCNAAKDKGLEAVGMKISAEELAGLKVPAIAHLWTNHFVIVEADGTGRLKVTDPPNEAKLVSVEEFKKDFSSFALLVSKDKDSFPKTEIKGPDLRLTEYVHDLGFVDQGEKLGFAVKCKNVGNEELNISSIDASCDCTSASTSNTKIAPGGETEINVVFDSNEKKGRQVQTIYINSNDPVTPTVQLQLIGVVRPEKVILRPQSINFGKLRRSESANKEIYIPDSSEVSANYSDTKLEIKEASTDTPFVIAAITHTPDEKNPNYTIGLSLKPGSPIGDFKGKVIINTNHPKELTIEVPITATIKGDIDVFPDTFFLGLIKKGKAVEKAITISTVGKDSLKIEKVDNPLEYVSVKLTPKTEGKEYSLTATLKNDAPTGYIKGDIVIHTNNPDQPEIKVPVLGLVEE